MVREITRVCIDCKSRLKNRSKSTKRCMECHRLNQINNPIGRICGNCSVCNKKLTIKKNKTGRCINCIDRTLIKRKKNSKPAWNKGISIFENEEHKRKVQNARRKELRDSMPNHLKIADRVRTLIRVTLKRCELVKKSKTTEIIGCSIIEYKKHIESQFEDWMSWDNYGNGKDKWNIDHIIPISYFDLTNDDELKKAFNYKNCRPLLSTENFIKSNKLI